MITTKYAYSIVFFVFLTPPPQQLVISKKKKHAPVQIGYLFQTPVLGRHIGI